MRGHFHEELSGARRRGSVHQHLRQVRQRDGLAKQVPGLNYTKWLSDRKNPSLAALVQTDQTTASTQTLGNTPSIIVRGPKGQVAPFQGVPSWSQLQQMITAAGG